MEMVFNGRKDQKSFKEGLALGYKVEYRGNTTYSVASFVTVRKQPPNTVFLGNYKADSKSHVMSQWNKM